MPWASSCGADTLLDVRVVPRARHSFLAGVRDGALLVRLAAPPVDDAANAALTEMLAVMIDVGARAVTLVSGARARRKRVRVAAAEVASRLVRHLPPA